MAYVGTNTDNVVAPLNIGQSAIYYDSAGDYYGDVPPNTDNDKWTLSFMYKTDDASSTNLVAYAERVTIAPKEDSIIFGSNASGNIYFIYREGTVAKANISATSVTLLNDTWYHVLVYIDTSQASASDGFNVYITKLGDAANNTKSAISTTTWSTGTIQFGTDEGVQGFNHVVWNSSVGSYISEYWDDRGGSGSSLDFNTESNRRQFIDSSGVLVELSLSGETSSGVTPFIYAKDGDLSNNTGSGGNATEVGSPTEATGPYG